MNNNIMSLPRREALKKLSTAAMGGITLLNAPSLFASNKNKVFKIGYVSPQIGPLAIFAEPDEFTLNQVRESLKDGITINRNTYAVEIIYKDSQSNSNRASEVASELILKNK